MHVEFKLCNLHYSINIKIIIIIILYSYYIAIFVLYYVINNILRFIYHCVEMYLVMKAMNHGRTLFSEIYDEIRMQCTVSKRYKRWCVRVVGIDYQYVMCISNFNVVNLNSLVTNLKLTLQNYITLIDNV